MPDNISASNYPFIWAWDWLTIRWTVNLEIWFNTFAATDELSHQLMCIVRCQWQE